ncbi:conserved hypothetical protein [Hyella patelloides LEGE 07179]|uniref:Pyrrolo-quinoline quinone repeat domain-containing protein n=1 Tax=Hyella patelloides LEGE 07179 TaxID=945734 RepID=A0A563W1V9_9CYAN|nr:PQQ-binding-like beta-propeller repeat protein [Hyella patelloides]VEP17661.1 conserved hypothetical protein [Hyella patelloides LEGE 07179]
MFKQQKSKFLGIVFLLILFSLIQTAISKKKTSLLANNSPKTETKQIEKSSETQQINFPLKWRTKIGLTTFRSTISYSNGKIIVGSNGESRSTLNDSSDGVYVIDSKTGKILRHIKNEVAGDTDINGVAIHQNILFFGSDNDRVFSYNFNGNQNWSFETNSDIEGAPSLTDITGDSFPDVIVASENGTVYALDGKNGNLIWNFQNQMEQAEGKYEYLSSQAFMSSPAVVDINNDGFRDVLIGGRNAIFYALDGKTGSVIWQYHTGSGIHSSAMAAHIDRNLRIILAESYSDIHLLDAKGQLQAKYELSAPSGGIQGLFSSPIYTPNGNIAIGSAWWDSQDDGFWLIPINTQNNELTSPLFTGENRVSATPLVADILGQKEPQIIIVLENNKLMVSSESGDLIATMAKEAQVEATPLIADIDNDGKNELLIAANDGYLYCYETNGGGSIYWGQFRGNNYNTGTF